MPKSSKKKKTDEEEKKSSSKKTKKSSKKTSSKKTSSKKKSTKKSVEKETKTNEVNETTKKDITEEDKSKVGIDEEKLESVLGMSLNPNLGNEEKAEPLSEPVNAVSSKESEKDVKDEPKIESKSSDNNDVNSVDSDSLVSSVNEINLSGETENTLPPIEKADEVEDKSVEDKSDDTPDNKPKSSAPPTKDVGISADDSEKDDKKENVATGAVGVAAGAAVGVSALSASNPKVDPISESKSPIAPDTGIDKDETKEEGIPEDKNESEDELDLASSLGLDTKQESPVLNKSIKGDSVEAVYETSSSKYKKIVIILLMLILAVVLGGIAYLYFSDSQLITPIPGEGKSETDDSEKGGATTSGDYENPINGVYFSSAEAAKFKDKKPIAVMVNNYEIARPSSGLSKADIVYEAVAESGITRLMPVFYSEIPENVSSIRSARYYFVELASAYKPHYIHWGAAHVPPCQKEPSTSPSYCPPVNGKIETEPDVDAYDRIVALGVANLDGGNYSCEASDCTFSRDPNKVGKIPLEHTAFVRLPLVYELAKDIREDDTWHEFIDITKWNFKDDAAESDRGDVGLLTPITYKYWDIQPAFDVKWEYDPTTNTYLRYQGGTKQTDGLDGSDIEAKVVIVRFTDQEAVGDKKNHLYHDIVGTGEALIFQDGKVTKGEWSRFNHDDRDIYVDESGSQIAFNRGQIWVQLVPTGNAVNYGQAPSVTPTE